MSHILDSGATAVGKSIMYDGIFPDPETGLQGVNPKTSLVDSLRNDVFQMVSVSVSQGADRATRMFKGKRRRNSNDSASEDSIGSHSDTSLAPSDWRFGYRYLTDSEDERASSPDTVYSEMEECNCCALEQAAVQRPISASLRSEQRKFVEELPAASSVDTSQEGSSGEDVEERRNWRKRSRLQRRTGNVPFVDATQQSREYLQLGEVDIVHNYHPFSREHRTEGVILQHDGSELPFPLNPSQVALDKDKRKWTPGIGTFQQWISENSLALDKPLLHHDSPSSINENVLAYDALLHLRSQNWNSAYQDAKKSIDIQPSTMAYVVKALAQIGNGDPEQAIQTFEVAFSNCNPDESDLLVLIKATSPCVAAKYDEAISCLHDLVAVSRDDVMMYRYNKVLAKIYLMQGDYECAAHSLERAQMFVSPYNGCHLESISLIFGWSSEGFETTVWQCYCEALYAAGHTEEAAEVLGKMSKNFDERTPASDGMEAWLTDFKNKCVDMLEVLGDKALDSEENDEAIARYSSALSLNPSNKMGIFMKRSEAQAAKGLWAGALADADEVIKLVPLSHRGHERKYMALLGMENYAEANNTLLHMVSIIENSKNEEIRRLRSNYGTAMREAVDAIDTAIRRIFTLCPLVLIDLMTGRLCDGNERVWIFKADTAFKKLVFEITTLQLDYSRMRRTVAKYFEWVMFSHTWEGKEPTFQDVNVVDSVWNLDRSSLNNKLRQFCTIAREAGYRWAWSDTCCIDKTTSAVLSQSLTSMYTWYDAAAETLVYLADILDSAKLGDLTKSRWMTRAWTLQELLASKVIRFYTRNWKLYLNDTRHNHKESPLIKQELAEAIGVAAETITSFHPDDLGVREKLRLASTRNATVEEDIAYSLIGIFSSDIAPRYGLGTTALGQLLENIVARTGDVAVISWTGKSLPYNSTLPDSLAVYSQAPYAQSLMEAEELDACVQNLRAELAMKDALTFYYQVIRLPRATFSNRCLQLPCIIFPVMKIGIQVAHDNQEPLYCATAALVGNVEFETADAIALRRPRKFVFVHPWLHDLRDPHDEIVLDDVESDSSLSKASYSRHSPLPQSSLRFESPATADHGTQALRLIARLGQPFSALLLERQNNGRYKRIATEHEIVISGVPHQTDPKDLRAKVLEVA